MYVATSKRCSREHDLAVYSVARGSDQGSSNGTEKVGGIIPLWRKLWTTKRCP